MRMVSLAAVVLCLWLAPPVKAQYTMQPYYYPNTGYAYSYINPQGVGYSPYFQPSKGGHSPLA